MEHEQVATCRIHSEAFSNFGKDCRFDLGDMEGIKDRPLTPWEREKLHQNGPGSPIVV